MNKNKETLDIISDHEVKEWSIYEIFYKIYARKLPLKTYASQNNCM